ncbi:MAG: phosphate ABC transporter substrate-binding protein PstS [Frankiaceae bacterium]
MKVTRTYALLPIALAGALAASACGTDNNSTGASGVSTSQAANASSCTKLSGAGSSFQDPMEQQWAKDFPGTCKGAQINYQAVGSGTGIQQFGQGTIDYAGSDVVMKSDEQAAADKRCGGSKAIHVPVSAGGVGVTWNLPGVTDLQFSPDTLAGIFQGTIKAWNDPQIKADNSGANLPSTPITVVYRSDSSGTTAVFTSFLTATSSKWKLGGDKTVNWPTGQGAEKNQGVSAAVAQTPGGITYTEQAFATQHQLPLGKIKSNSGSYVALTTASVTAGVADAKFAGSGNNLVYESNFKTTKSDAYPISSYTYAIVCSAYPSSFGATKVDTLKKFLTYAVTAGQQAAPGLGFSPLPPDVAGKVQQAVSAVK